MTPRMERGEMGGGHDHDEDGSCVRCDYIFSDKRNTTQTIGMHRISSTRVRQRRC